MSIVADLFRRPDRPNTRMLNHQAAAYSGTLAIDDLDAGLRVVDIEWHADRPILWLEHGPSNPVATFGGYVVMPFGPKHLGRFASAEFGQCYIRWPIDQEAA